MLNYFGWFWNQIQASAIAMWQWKCHKAHQQPGSTFKNKAYWCLPSFHKRSPTKGEHLYWECGHQWSTYRYIHQAIGWENVLQAKEWVEHIGFLKYVLMHPPHSYDMSLLRAIQGKRWLAWHTSLLRTCLVHLDIFEFNRLIHENQMNLIVVWYHYCFFAWFGLVVSYDMFVGL